jgi:hypothetical protein
MTMARSRLVDTSVTRWYHCISRCVRRAYLLAEGETDRKQWIEDRLETLAQIFSISVGGFSILDNHLHILLRLDPDVAAAWTDDEVVRRWGALFPPRDRRGKPLPLSREWIESRQGDRPWLATARARLCNLGWFMKCLKEPLSRMANRQEQARGAFFEGRYKSIAILDTEALLATAAYIDLNPVAAGIAAAPETSEHTSVKQRVEHVQAQDRTDDLRAAERGSLAAQEVSAGLEEAHWLCPIEDRREQEQEPKRDGQREGMVPGFTLGNYFLLVEYTGRLLRQGKAAISQELAGIFDRLGSRADVWNTRLLKLSGGDWMGRCMAASAERLKEGSSD